MLTLTIVDGAIDKVPCWGIDSKSKNYAAFLDRDAAFPGGLSYEFWKKYAGEQAFYVVPPDAAGRPVEFCADHYSAAGRPSREKRHFVVDCVMIHGDTGDGFMYLTEYNSASRAIEASRSSSRKVEAIMTAVEELSHHELAQLVTAINKRAAILSGGILAGEAAHEI